MWLEPANKAKFVKRKVGEMASKHKFSNKTKFISLFKILVKRSKSHQ